jgi:hypothetical protein
MKIIVALGERLSYIMVKLLFSQGGPWTAIAIAVILAFLVYVTKVDWGRYLDGISCRTRK